MHSFGNTCKTLIFPLPLPTSPGLDAAVPGFGNVCDNMLHSVCGPGGEHGGFSFVGGNTEPFVSSALVKAVPVPWLWCEVEGFWGGLALRES